MRIHLLPCLLALAACTGPSGDTGEACSTPAWSLGEVVDTEGCGVLATVDAPWGGDLWVIRVEGSHREMGYQYGRLLGPTMVDLWWRYMGAVAEEAGLGDAEAVDFILGGLMDSAWEHYQPHVPPAFLEELRGVGEGMDAAGVEYGDHDSEVLPTRLVTMIDLAMSSQLDVEHPTALTDYLSTGYSDPLRAYWGMEDPPAPDPAVVDLVETARSLGWQGSLAGPPLQCSFFAAWGDRTDDGGLYATRNMDFTADTGASEYASMAIFVPDGGVPYASISWVGANLGALAGISAEGLTVSAVGASSPFERITTEPALFRAREALESARSLDEAMVFLDGSLDDGIVRAPTIGYNALVTWGDPSGDGAAAQAAILENNGLSAGVFHHLPDGTVRDSLLRFDPDGAATLHTPETWPELVNAEADAVEIDADAQVRLFAHDGDDYVMDDGRYVEDPDGVPLQTGYPLPRALYRGDEAMAYGVRQHQTACNGPADGGDDVMVQGGSYRKRYTPMHDMAVAYATGTPFEWEGQVVIEDAGGTPVPIGLDQAEAISRVAAMDENTWDVVYDATDLVIRLSFESGTGESWVPASDQPAFLEIDLEELW